MNREDIIRMAHESHLDVYGLGKDYAKFADALERFAALVASAAVRETSAEYRLGWNDGQIAEREACAKLCDDLDDDIVDGLAGWQYADAIRARGQA